MGSPWRSFTRDFCRGGRSFTRWFTTPDIRSPIQLLPRDSLYLVCNVSNDVELVYSGIWYNNTFMCFKLKKYTHLIHLKSLHNSTRCRQHLFEYNTQFVQKWSPLYPGIRFVNILEIRSVSICDEIVIKKSKWMPHPTLTVWTVPSKFDSVVKCFKIKLNKVGWFHHKNTSLWASWEKSVCRYVKKIPC